MCLLKLNHHDLTSKIHTVKSYKLTQAEDEIKRSKCTRFVHLHDLCSLSGACAVVFQLCRPTPTRTQRSNVCACASVGVAKRRPKWRSDLVGLSWDTQIASLELKTTTQASKSVHIFLLRYTVATCRSDVKQYIKLKQWQLIVRCIRFSKVYINYTKTFMHEKAQHWKSL